LLPGQRVMTNPKPIWFIDEYVQHRNDVDLYSVIKKQGFDVHVKSYVPFKDSNKITEVSNEDCAVVYGTVNFVKANTHIFGNYFSHKKYEMTHYRSEFFNATWTNSGFYTTWIDLSRNFNMYCAMLGSDHIFVRPNSGVKTFTGFVISKESFSSDISATQQLTSVLNDTLVFVSSAKNIDEEYRFFIVGQEVVGYSTYMVKGNIEGIASVPSSAMEFASEFATACAEPLVLDVARVGDSFSALEINCINSSGFYQANVESVVHRLSEFVTNKWIEIFDFD
jgi:hypothetical protein